MSAGTISSRNYPLWDGDASILPQLNDLAGMTLEAATATPTTNGIYFVA